MERILSRGGTGGGIAGYLRRMNGYLDEMYPLWKRVPAAGLLAVSFFTLLRAAHGQEAPGPVLPLVLGAWSLVFLTLVLRLMDELKDVETDRALFPGRPLPSGRVRESDIRLSLAAAATCFLIPQLLLPGAVLTAAVVLGYAFLMFRYFFMPDLLRRNLLLNLATHNPVIPLLLLHLVALYRAGEGTPLGALRRGEIVLLVAMYWGMSFAWEIGRKIRSREEETAYVTYSQVLGRRVAVVLTAAAQTMTFALGVHFFTRFGLPLVCLMVLAAGYGLALAKHLRFWLRPGPSTSNLRPFAERFVLAVVLAGALAAGIEMLERAGTPWNG